MTEQLLEEIVEANVGETFGAYDKRGKLIGLVVSSRKHKGTWGVKLVSSQLKKGPKFIYSSKEEALSGLSLLRGLKTSSLRLERA